MENSISVFFSLCSPVFILKGRSLEGGTTKNLLTSLSEILRSAQDDKRGDLV